MESENIDINKIGNQVMQELREVLKEKYPRLRSYLQNNNPDLVKLYDYYYEKAMESPWQIAVEYTYRILRLYAQVKPWANKKAKKLK